MKVVGLAGGSASGKSTVAGGLARALGDHCLVLAHDWYYRTLPPEHAANPAGYNFDHPCALDTHLLVADLDRLRRGESARVPDYDFARHARRSEAYWRELPPRPIVLVEGILVLEDAGVRSRLDLSVFVDAPESTRLARRIARDRAVRGRSEAEVREQYARTVGPMHARYVEPSRAHADLILDGTREPELLVAELLALL